MKHISKNLHYLRKCSREQQYDGDELIKGKRGVALEGSSRSTKTIAGVDFIIYLCTTVETNCTINILKETFAEFKTTLYDDFNKRLDAFLLPNPFAYKQEVKSFRIFGNKINLIGADKISKVHGASCDYLWVNEPLEIRQQIFDQFEMRCRKFWWMDYNPSVTQHWIYDKVLNRPDVGHLRSTFKDNRYISVQEKAKILSYEPWLPGSYEIQDQNIIYLGQVVTEKHYPPPHPENIENGTADEFMWRVYGLGLRGAMKGLIYKQVSYIDEFPDIAFTWGMDFGFVNDPTALVKYAEEGNDIYLELFCYHPIDNPEDLDALLKSLGVKYSTPITADSSDKYQAEKKVAVRMVSDLWEMGWEIDKVSKTKRLTYWIGKMKSRKIHIVKNDLSHFAKKEQENYKYKEVNGIQIPQPIDAFNHFWDSSRYAFMSHQAGTVEAEHN